MTCSLRLSRFDARNINRRRRRWGIAWIFATPQDAAMMLTVVQSFLWWAMICYFNLTWTFIFSHRAFLFQLTHNRRRRQTSSENQTLINHSKQHEENLSYKWLFSTRKTKLKKMRKRTSPNFFFFSNLERLNGKKNEEGQWKLTLRIIIVFRMIRCWRTCVASRGG